MVIFRIGQRLTPVWAGGLLLLGLLNPLGAATMPAPDDQSGPRMASNGEITLVVWQDHRHGSDYDIYGARLNNAGVVLDNIRLSSAAGDQVHPSVACNGSDFLVVWTDYRSGVGADIYGTRVSAAGEVLDSQGLPVCALPMDQAQPAVASDGLHYLVVWQDFRSRASADIYGARVSSSGVVLDPAGLVISQGANNELNPAVSGNAAGFLVVWQDFRSGAAYDIYGTLLSSAGAVGSPAGFAISTASSDQINPAVSGNGTDFLVVWQDIRSDSNFDIYGTIVTGSGVASAPNGMIISAASRNQFNPVVSSLGPGYLVAWTDFRDGANNVIYGARIANTGAVDDVNGLVISSTDGEHYHPAVAGNSTGYWVAWQDYRHKGAADIYGSRVTSAGTGSDPGGVLLSVENGVTPQNPVITWAKPADLVYGTALGATQLNATADVPGNFQYSPASGTILAAGNSQTLTVTFTPNDTLNYARVSTHVAINILPAPLTIQADHKTKIVGQPNPPLTATYLGFVNGDAATSLSTPVTLATTATTSSPAGEYPITASGATSPNYAIDFVNGTLTVSASAVTLTGLTVQPASQSIHVSQSAQFMAQAAYSDGATLDVTSVAAWQSSNPVVATVDNHGLAKGLTAGTATVTASLSNFTASASLRVATNNLVVTRTFNNRHEIEIHNGRASDYPSDLRVSGLSGKITKITATLNHLNLKDPHDVSILLVSPAGQKVVLMSGAGGSRELDDINLTLDDSAATALPQSRGLRTGVYRPANYSTSLAFPSPAPRGPYASTLTAFNNAAPNGRWRLYIISRTTHDEGSLDRGWSITITTTPTP